MITYPLNNVLYSAEDAELFHCTRTSGVFARDEDFAISVTGADNAVTINEGIAWIRNSKFSGKVIAMKNAATLTFDVSDSLYPRIDAVVIQFNANTNSTSLIIKKGTANTSPVAPEVVRTEAVYELHLYHVLRAAGSVSITTDVITDLRENQTYCGLMADDVSAIDVDLSGVVPITRTINGKTLENNITLTPSDIGSPPTSRKINNKPLSSDITITAADISAVPSTREINSKPLSGDVTLTASDVGAVPTSRTVNGKSLSANISLSASDVSAVPTSRTINGKALSSNISLTASDVGAAPAYTYGTDDLTAGTSALATGTLYFVYE